MTLKVTILGCGASGGVPLIGCTCPTCLSPDPKDKRLRASVLVEKGDTRLLIDTSPDLRQQALRAGFKHVDAILLTHPHADHLHGIDDVRPFNYHGKAAIPLYTDAATLEIVKARFPYCFQVTMPTAETGWYRPALIPHIIQLDGSPVAITSELSIQPYLQIHGKTHSIGVRIGNFAYATDVNSLPEQSLQTLENLDVLVVDCLQREPAPTHAHLAMSLAWIERLKPKRAYLTHMGHAFTYEALKRELPPTIEPAYDGLTIYL